MKKINSIGYGGRIAAAAGIFLAAVPLAVLALNTILPFTGYKTWMYISPAIGALIALFLIGPLAVELRQDKRMNAYYHKHSHMKMYPGNGIYEFQSWGNRDALARDAVCRAWGIRFDKDR